MNRLFCRLPSPSTASRPHPPVLPLHPLLKTLPKLLRKHYRALREQRMQRLWSSASAANLPSDAEKTPSLLRHDARVSKKKRDDHLRHPEPRHLPLSEKRRHRSFRNARLPRGSRSLSNGRDKLLLAAHGALCWRKYTAFRCSDIASNFSSIFSGSPWNYAKFTFGRPRRRQWCRRVWTEWEAELPRSGKELRSAVARWRRR